MHVHASDGTVTLSGRVDFPYQREEAEEVAMAVPGVSEIRNHLSVWIRVSVNEVTERVTKAIGEAGADQLTVSTHAQRRHAERDGPLRSRPRRGGRRGGERRLGRRRRGQDPHPGRPDRPPPGYPGRAAGASSRSSRARATASLRLWASSLA